MFEPEDGDTVFHQSIGTLLHIAFQNLKSKMAD
jgi:hypothetical protein